MVLCFVGKPLARKFTEPFEQKGYSTITVTLQDQSWVEAGRFDVVIVSPEGVASPEMDKLLTRLRGRQKRVVLILKEKDRHAVHTAMALGIYDILFEPVDVETLLSCLQKPSSFSDALALLDPSQKKSVLGEQQPSQELFAPDNTVLQRGRVAVFWSANGGEGKTTLAASFVRKLAAQTGKEVVVADLKEVTPHLHLVFGTEKTPKKGFAESLASKDWGTAAMRDWVRKAADRVWLFSGFGVDEFHLVGAESLEKLIVSLRNEFPYVIVEVNGGIAFASTVAGLSQGDRIYVPVLPTWASVQDTRDVLAFVSGKWGLDIKRVAAVLNRTRFGSEIDLAAASAALPVRVIGEVGENKFTRLNFMIADFVTPKAEGE